MFRKTWRKIAEFPLRSFLLVISAIFMTICAWQLVERLLDANFIEKETITITIMPTEEGELSNCYIAAGEHMDVSLYELFDSSLFEGKWEYWDAVAHGLSQDLIASTGQNRGSSITFELSGQADTSLILLKRVQSPRAWKLPPQAALRS